MNAIADVSVIDSIEGYPDKQELTCLLRTTAPDIVFIDTDSVSGCAVTATLLKDLVPRTTIVAIGKSCGESVLTALMEAGCDEYLAAPIDYRCLRDCFDRARSQRGASLQACIPGGFQDYSKNNFTALLRA